MEHIYSKIKPDLLLHSVFRIRELEDLEVNRVDVTDAKHFLQCVIMKLEQNDLHKAHRHIVKPQQNFEFQVQEAFIIMIGQVLITIYDIDNTKLEEVILNAGDLAILLSGAHSIMAKTLGTVMYEVKTGPYEGQLLDKEFIDIK